MRHESAMLRDYLVAGVEDPRLNLQSILSRHYLIRALAGDRFDPLMRQEYRFSAVMNWLLAATKPPGAAETGAMILHGLKRGADNVEGIEIPQFALETFASLPLQIGALTVPNYIEKSLVSLDQPAGGLELDTFCAIWREAIGGWAAIGGPEAASRLSVIEPACGSANDYRFIEACGLAAHLDYTGFDLCERNVENARLCCPRAKFLHGNVFQIEAADRSFDLCFVHDLFEHLSLEGLATAVRELCRVTRLGICAGFFQMHEMPEHVVREVDEYHWNTLSMEKSRELFMNEGFQCRVVHIGSFLKAETGCDQTHNPNAYTLMLWRAGSSRGNEPAVRPDLAS
jgi:ubiquinone/menaquinone biosynthesis C-methylase UbiE